MIWTVIQTSWRRLRNNRSELLLTFIVPIIFFSIFAIIFGSRGSTASGTPRIKVAIADEVKTQASRRTVELLGEQQSLRIAERGASPDSRSSNTKVPTVSKRVAEDLLRRGMVSAAIVFMKDKDAESKGTTSWRVEVLADSYDQVATQVMTALVQKAALTAVGDIAAQSQLPSDIRLSHDSGDAATVGRVERAAFAGELNEASKSLPLSSANLPSIETVDVLGGKKTNPVIAMYAAGIAVMFLLFSATTASGSLLEERENSTLDRLLCSRLTMDQLLLGKWAYLTTIGMLQMTLMFGWGALVFGIELMEHLEGFIAMTIVTAGAASGFALLLASLCRTRVQLGWVSTIVILTMSALGGSMVPRYLMSESMQRAGLFTFNAWALEGYNKVFWRELPVRDIGLELAVLTLCGFSFIVCARVFAVRWERT